MRVHRARSRSGLFLSFSILLWACGTFPGSGGPPEETGPQAEAATGGEDSARAERPAGAAVASARRGSAADRTLAPYFFVEGGDGAAEPLPLKSTLAEVYLAGAIAEVQVTQIYRNQGAQPLQAVYVFPASTRAAVHSMKMTVGARTLTAQIRERGEARRLYETARWQGRTASLLEQQRPNVFQMNVANILPGDEIRVELRYAELLVPEQGVYEFVYPTTVGPRYSGRPARESGSGDDFVAAPVLAAGVPSPSTFALSATLRSGIPIRMVQTPSHPAARITQDQPTAARLDLPASSEAGNRDFVLRYALAGNRIESGLLLEPGESANHFLLMIEPPQRIEPRVIVPREYIFVVDVSGSMDGFPLATSKKLMHHLFSGLRAQDTFNILSFSGGSALLAPSSLPATAENVRRAMSYTSSWTSGGGTELRPALTQALSLPRSPDTARIIVVITDGYVAVEKETFALIRDSLGKANLFAFGIGAAVNRFLIEGMARAGQGEPFVVLNEQEAEDKAAAFQSYIRAPVLQGVRARFAGFDAYDVESEVLPDLFAERPIVVQGKYRGPAQGQVIIQGRAATGDFAQTLDVAAAVYGAQRKVLDVLWARTRIARLTDWEGARDRTHQEEITKLGLEHNLLTSYTSFVAVDSAARAEGRKGQTGQTVKQPSPMPAGVSDSAIGLGQSPGSRAGRSGILGAINGPPVMAAMAAVSGFGASGLGRDGADAMGGLVGSEIGDAYGAGGFGLVGSGSGGGGTLGSIGVGAYGSRGASLAGGRQGKAAGSLPEVLWGPLQVRGALSAELIARILRRHLPEVKFCYESQLVRHPGLEGLVTLRFVISSLGAVLTSSVQSTTLGSPAVEQCLASAVRRWEFPRPRDGLADVTAPFKLAPSRSRGAARAPAAR